MVPAMVAARMVPPMVGVAVLVVSAMMPPPVVVSPLVMSRVMRPVVPPVLLVMVAVMSLLLVGARAVPLGRRGGRHQQRRDDQ